VRIEIFEGGKPSATVSVPVWLVAGPTGRLSKFGGEPLQGRVDFDQVAEMFTYANASGQLLEIEGHAQKDRIVTSVVSNS
jgi:hypothetical protein